MASQDTGSVSQDTGSTSQDTGSASQDTGSASQDTGSASQDTGKPCPYIRIASTGFNFKAFLAGITADNIPVQNIITVRLI